MSDDSTTIKNPLLQGLDAGLSSTRPAATKKSGEVTKDEFLQLLVTQLKNQDPLNPMENDRFAVDLAQFSQLEQLVGINNKIQGGGGDATSLASYLGTQVSLDGDAVEVAGGDGGLLRIDVPERAQRVRIELLDATGAVRERVDLEDVDAGKQTIRLEGLSVPNGEYTFQVSGTSTIGGELTIGANVAGIVTGFIPGPDPTLLVNGKKQVKPGDIREVTLPQT